MLTRGSGDCQISGVVPCIVHASFDTTTSRYWNTKAPFKEWHARMVPASSGKQRNPHLPEVDQRKIRRRFAQYAYRQKSSSNTAMTPLVIAIWSPMTLPPSDNT